jgi:uncharacterized protein with PQ loop repeat
MESRCHSRFRRAYSLVCITALLNPGSSLAKCHLLYICRALLTVLAIALLAFLPIQPPHPLLHTYARFLGLSSALLAITQYAPQLYHTYHTRLVGALSIGTMIIQVPGSVLFVGSLVGRQGVEWSTWLTYAVTGAMQAALLVSIVAVLFSLSLTCCLLAAITGHVYSLETKTSKAWH